MALQRRRLVNYLVSQAATVKRQTSFDEVMVYGAVGQDLLQNFISKRSTISSTSELSMSEVDLS